MVGGCLFGRLMHSGDIHQVGQTTRACWPPKKRLERERDLVTEEMTGKTGLLRRFSWTSRKGATWKDPRLDSGKDKGLTMPGDSSRYLLISRCSVESPGECVSMNRQRLRKGATYQGSPIIRASLHGLKQTMTVGFSLNWERALDTTMQNLKQCPRISEGVSQRANGKLSLQGLVLRRCPMMKSGGLQPCAWISTLYWCLFFSHMRIPSEMMLLKERAGYLVTVMQMI